MRKLLTAVLLMAGCPRPPGPQPAAEDGTNQPTTRPVALPMGPSTVLSRAIDDAACDGVPVRCWVLGGGAIADLDPVTLAIGSLTPIGGIGDGAMLDPGPDGLRIQHRVGGQWLRAPVEGDRLGAPTALVLTTEEDDDEPDVARTRARWNLARERHHRIPFHRDWPTPDGGMLMLQRAGIGGTSTLVKLGSPPRMVPVPMPPTEVRYSASIAMHPTGTEFYLMPWPSSALRAMDPQSMRTRWQLELDGAAYGLFVDPTGRFLVAVSGGNGRSERFTDFPATGPVELDEDPAGDLALHRRTRPDATRTAVIDLAIPKLVAEVQGEYRRFVHVDAGAYLVVTTRGVVRLANEGS